MRVMSFVDLLRDTANKHYQGFELMKAKRPEARQVLADAESGYINLLNADPDNPQALFLRGTLCLQIQDSGAAICYLEKCVELQPDFFDAWNNLGAAYRQYHHNDKALWAYEKALEINQEAPDVMANMAALRVNEGKPLDGIPYGEKCLELQPDHPQGRWNLGLLYMEAERYSEGFRLYNNGFDTGDRIERNYTDSRGKDAPFWWGPKDGKGSAIVLFGEQGQGDELLFLQFVPYVREYFDRVIIDCHPKLFHLVKRAYPWATVYPTRKEAAPWAQNEVFDFKQSLASLPEWFHEKRKENTGWLKADFPKVQLVRQMIRYGQQRLGQEGWPVVGIHWAGGKQKTRHDLRSIHLEKWQPIMDLPVTLVSHQYTKSAHEEAGKFPERILHWQTLTGDDKDYDWNIALVAACDLLISVNTSAVHAAGSMDVPCWTLTPFGRAWRYGMNTGEITTNPWYNTVRQFNQQEGQPWEEVIGKVAEELAAWIG